MIRKLITVTGLLVVCAGTAIATGAVPDSNDGEVHFCYGISEGDARVIDHEAGRRCKSFEREVVVNREGSPGVDGVSGYEYVSTGLVSSTLDHDSIANRTVSCPEGSRAVGGGVDITGSDPGEVESFQILGSARNPSDERQWYAVIRNTDAVQHNLTAVISAICVFIPIQ